MPFMLELELKDVRLRGHDHFWDVIRQLGKDGGTFTIKDVVGETNAHKDTVHDFVRRLERAGFVASAGKQGEGRWAQKQFRLVESPHETPSLRRDGSPGFYGRGRQQMWNVIRGPQARAGIDANELVLLAATEDVNIALGSAQDYLKKLRNAGYLTVVEKAAHNRLTRYRLRPSMNTGPHAPKALRTQVIYDPNLRALVGDAVAEEVSA